MGDIMGWCDARGDCGFSPDVECSKIIILFLQFYLNLVTFLSPTEHFCLTYICKSNKCSILQPCVFDDAK